MTALSDTYGPTTVETARSHKMRATEEHLKSTQDRNVERFRVQLEEFETTVQVELGEYKWFAVQGISPQVSGTVGGI